jgi:hypothetical protein
MAYLRKTSATTNAAASLRKPAEHQDAQNLIVHRGQLARYAESISLQQRAYAIVPYQHVASLEAPDGVGADRN